ncbi:Endonuclease/exonuclease/phosphatase [Phlyctochytrium arcticum]|nr:Endonuclease/exonuclease/phosphatase [Phlyctochytrium arcticum]
MHSAPVRTPTLPPTHFESDITRSATTPASPKRPPLPPRPTSPGDRQAALRRATSPVAIYPLIKTKTVSEPSVAPPLIPLRPHARAVEEAVESYVASTTTPDIPSLDGKYTGLRGGEKTYSPDTVHTNRRPPLAEHLPNTDIYLKTPPRCFAISGFYACSGSEKIRVWYIPTGENIRTISVGEMKMYAFAFPPTLYVEDEGRYLWVALEKGEIIEVDISVGEIVDRRSLHSATVTHMMRYHGQLWTLDENGALKIWSVDPERQRVSLQQRPRGVRVSGKQTVAFAANDRLWTAAGKVIEVYHPMGDMSSCFQQRFEISMTAGQVTCFAATRDGTIVFSGHDDGKITVWDAVHLVKKRVITAGMYRVTSLLGVGSEYLWAGFSTGKIYIYDVRKIDGGWTAVKEFSAYHSNSVDEMLIDDRSVFLSGYLHIASLSENGQVRIWDGFMLRDWQERQLQLRESEMCTYREVSVLVCSWNLDATKPAELEESRSPEDNGFLQRWLSQVDQPDILVVGFQELVDLESKKVTAKNLLKGGKKSQQSHIDQRFKLWQDALIKVVQQAQPRARYHVLSCRQLVGLFQCVLLKESEVLRVKDLSAISVKTGLGGYHGNKGGIATRFVIDDSSFCFVNCHLAAHQNQVSARNNDTATILKDAQFPAKPEYHGIFVGGGDGTVILDHENVFWSGDLNYRIDLPRERVLELIDQQDWSALQENDQLIRQMITNPSFGLRGFSEGALTFAPTFKYDIGKDRYDSSEKRRVPSWCDRILYRGPDIRQHFYNRYPPSISDHRPIAAAFSIRVKSVDQNRLPAVKQEVEVKRQQYLASLLESEKMLWLKDCAGCSYEEAQAALAEASGDLRLARDRADVLRVQSSLA